MKIKIKIEKEVEIKTLVVLSEPRYWEDATVNETEDEEGELIPCREADLWKPIIDIDAGIITNWEKGKKADIHYKVCDCCGWQLLDEKGNIVLKADDGYVPGTLSPAENGYGDYIIMKIDENGKIEDWAFDINDFADAED